MAHLLPSKCGGKEKATGDRIAYRLIGSVTTEKPAENQTRYAYHSLPPSWYNPSELQK
jgi:hypothetical protein